MADRRLSGLDAVCLALESARAPLHTVAVLMLDASSRPAGDLADTLMHALSGLVDRSERLRGTVVPAPFGLAAPSLIDEGPPDLDHHLTRLRAPSPGGPRDLARIVDDLLSTPLARGCPLWEAHLVEGLASGASALVLKLHCVPVDGTTAWSLALALKDRIEGRDTTEAHSAQDGAAPTPRAIALDAGWIAWLGERPGRLLSASMGLAEAATRSLRGPEPGSSPRPTPPPGSRLNAPTTGGRRAAHATLRASTLERVGKAFAVSPDDVVLATLAGALRTELAAAGETHARPLVAAVLRDKARPPSPGLPRITLERLPVHVALPGARLRLVHRDRETGPDLLPAPWRTALVDWVEAATPVVFTWLARAAGDLGLDARLARIANLLVTFSEGAGAASDVAGVRIEHLYPHGPLPEGIHLHLAAQRIGAAVDVGITVAGDVLPDPWRFAAALGDALRELDEAALALEG